MNHHEALIAVLTGEEVRERDELTKFIHDFINVLRHIFRLFENLYRDIYLYGGNFYSDLRVSPWNEIVIYLKLTLPFQPQEFQITHYEPDSCYAFYSLTDQYIQLEDHREMLRTLFQNGYLMPELVLRWFDDIVPTGVRVYNENIAQRIVLNNGILAVTLPNHDQPISVQLVPVINCDIPLETHHRVIGVSIATSMAILLPEQPPFQNNEAVALYGEDVIELNRLWLINMYQAERRILSERLCSRAVIRLLKLLRIRQEWLNLDAYYLKSVVMWMIVNNPHTILWGENQLVPRFVQALTHLKCHLTIRTLLYLFRNGNNMFMTLSSEALFANNEDATIIRRIDQIIGTIRDNVEGSAEILKTYFEERRQ